MSTAMTDLEQVDLSQPDAFRQGPPYELFRVMREEAPIFPNRSRDDSDFWSITRYDDIKRVTADWETFSSARPTAFMHDSDPIVPVDVLQQQMINMDPPRQGEYRRISRGRFTPPSVAKLEEELSTTYRAIVDRVASRGECDFVHDLAVELPLLAITRILGIESPDIAQFHRWTEILFGSQDADLRGGPEVLGQAIHEIGEYLAELVEERRVAPRDDLLTRLIDAQVDGKSLSFPELQSNFMLMFGAGNETTRNSLTLGMIALMEHPEQRQKLLDDLSLLPNAVEEILRWATPLMHFRRTATRDAEIAGQRIAAGDKVVMWYVAGNRDGRAFPDPDVFDITRDLQTNTPLTFGNGIHRCLGQHLARLELRIMLTELLTRIPDMEPAGEPVKPVSNWFHGVSSMPVHFTPAA
jgi:cytochrome P450